MIINRAQYFNKLINPSTFQFRTLSDKAIGDDLRQKFRSLPSPVFCITSSTEPAKQLSNIDNSNESVEIAAITVNSVGTVSLDPPTISFNIKLPSKFDNLLLSRKTCAIHMLSTNQTQISQKFSKPGSKFDNVEYFNSHNLPIIKGSKWALIGDLEQSVLVADHRVWFAKIRDIVNIESDDSKPSNLIYFNGNYHKIG